MRDHDGHRPRRRQVLHHEMPRLPPQKPCKTPRRAHRAAPLGAVEAGAATRQGDEGAAASRWLRGVLHRRIDVVIAR
ncbi:hypothetical protein ACFPRL_31885 [Pseudoclavibacter helvolus]